MENEFVAYAGLIVSVMIKKSDDKNVKMYLADSDRIIYLGRRYEDCEDLIRHGFPWYVYRLPQN
jgi:hypothetical protein